MFDAHRLNCPSRKVVSTKKISSDVLAARSCFSLSFVKRVARGRSIGVLSNGYALHLNTPYPLLQSASFQYPSLRSLSRNARVDEIARLDFARPGLRTLLF